MEPVSCRARRPTGEVQEMSSSDLDFFPKQGQARVATSMARRRKLRAMKAATLRPALICATSAVPLTWLRPQPPRTYVAARGGRLQLPSGTRSIPPEVNGHLSQQGPRDVACRRCAECRYREIKIEIVCATVCLKNALPSYRREPTEDKVRIQKESGFFRFPLFEIDAAHILPDVKGKRGVRRITLAGGGVWDWAQDRGPESRAKVPGVHGVADKIQLARRR